jgi:hypothetical protein
MTNKIELPSNWGCDERELKSKHSAFSSNTYEITGAPILVIAGKVALKLY